MTATLLAPTEPDRMPSAAVPAVSRRWRPEAAALVVAMSALPALVPAGPGNTGIADVGMAVAVITVVVWLRKTSSPVRLPYAVGTFVLVLAGSLAALRAGSLTSSLALVQDVFMLVWAGVIANACRDPRLLRATTRAWCYSSTAWATFMVTASLSGQKALAGVSDEDGTRAALTFGDPNLAGNYFATSLFVVLACKQPANRLLRWCAVAVLIAAISFTGSNGAVLYLGMGLAVGFLLGIHRRRGIVPALAASILLGIVVMAVRPYIDIGEIQARAAASVPLLHDSVGRSGESSAEREKLLTEGMRLYWQQDVLGIGPGRTKATLSRMGAPYVKEAHDDYLATLIERGVIGGVGLILLGSTVWMRMSRVVGRPALPEYRAIVPRPEMLAAAAAAFLIAAFFYEVLHFRHLWALLGIAAGLDLWGRRR